VPKGDARRLWLAVAAVALGAVVLRALAFSGTELYGDEAYYYLWSLRPAAGYFDHPPLVAWLIAAGKALVPGELGVRLLFLLAGGLGAVFAALLARELLGEGEGAPRAILGAALLAASAPLLHLLGALALPDAPLAAAYTAALWLFARARGTRFLWAGLSVGVALLAKYTAALLAPALLLLVFLDPELRRELATPFPWLGALLATALFAPCLAWNAAHGFVSLRFQLGHGFGGEASLRSVAEYLVGQLLGCGPVALLVGLAFLLRARTSPERRVAAAVLLPLAVTTLSALRGRVEANWPSLVYPALCAAAAVGLARGSRALARALLLASTVAGFGLLALFASVERAPGLFLGTPAVERFHGWRDAAILVRERAERACRKLGCDGEQPFLFTDSYQTAGELAFYGGFRRFGPAAERPSQLDLWGDRPRPGEPFLFVGPGRAAASPRRTFRAEGEQPTERVEASFGGRALRDLAVTPFARYVGEAPRS